MRVILSLAISADGFIAKPDGDSDWVSPSDEEVFVRRIQETGCVVVGKRTFDQYQNSIYPIEGAVNIVLTKTPRATLSGALTASSPEEAIQIAKDKTCHGLVIAGGGHTSASFLDANLIDEIYFSVYPLILGQGIKPFEGQAFEKKLELIDSKNLEDGLTELHYRVLKRCFNQNS